MSTFGPHLRRLFDASGYDQKTLADKAGVSVSTLQNYLSGKTIPDLDVSVLIADALGITVDDLIPSAWDRRPRERPSVQEPLKGAALLAAAGELESKRRRTAKARSAGQKTRNPR